MLFHDTANGTLLTEYISVCDACYTTLGVASQKALSSQVITKLTRGLWTSMTKSLLLLRVVLLIIIVIIIIIIASCNFVISFYKY